MKNTNNKKKLLLILLAVSVIFALVACASACEHVDANLDGVCDSCNATIADEEGGFRSIPIIGNFADA